MNRVWSVALILPAALVASYAWSGRAAPASGPRKGDRPGLSAASPPSAAKKASARAVVPAPDAINYIAVGGGATPEYTEVSLEQDIQLALQVLHGPGTVLFAGGRDSASVRTVPAQAAAPSLLQRLGELFDPRGDRDSRYRRTELDALAASNENFEKTFTQALRSGKTPLLVYVASHGLQGEHARDNHIELWGGEPLAVKQLDALQASATRPVRFVIASCYAGGFAELAFHNADPSQGPARVPRCGLFAGTWDRQTSGCDPNPDRRVQEGYSMHVLHALRGQDRAGNPIPLEQLDLDHDGAVSLLEAHTRARIVSHSIDVPTTTSERYLREVEHRQMTPNLKLLPEEAAVVRQLGARLGLLSKAAAEKRYRSLGVRLDRIDAELNAADAELSRAQGRLAALLLARWPVLNDPYHDQFADTLKQSAAEIAALLDKSSEAKRYASASEHVEEISARASELDPEEAEALRLVRAYETLSLATSLTARGGAALQYYRALLACERSVL